MDMPNTQLAPTHPNSFLEINQLAQDWTREVLNLAEVNDKPYVGPDFERIDQVIQPFGI
jgi:hypothetical protein